MLKFLRIFSDYYKYEHEICSGMSHKLLASGATGLIPAHSEEKFWVSEHATLSVIFRDNSR